MVSSSVRSRRGGVRLTGMASSLIAPPFHRRIRSACPDSWSRCTVMFTSSSRVRSSLLAVLTGGGRRVPDGLQVVAERQDRGALGGGEGCGPGGLAAGELGLGGGQLGKRL